MQPRLHVDHALFGRTIHDPLICRLVVRNARDARSPAFSFKLRSLSFCILRITRLHVILFGTLSPFLFDRLESPQATKRRILFIFSLKVINPFSHGGHIFANMFRFCRARHLLQHLSQLHQIPLSHSLHSFIRYSFCQLKVHLHRLIPQQDLMQIVRLFIPLGLNDRPMNNRHSLLTATNNILRHDPLSPWVIRHNLPTKFWTQLCQIKLHCAIRVLHNSRVH